MKRTPPNCDIKIQNLTKTRKIWIVKQGVAQMSKGNPCLSVEREINFN